MKLTPAKLKGRIKSLAQKNHADARILLRIFMMERFLERISVSDARHHFIIKGGILVTSMIGVALRSTMDIDASIKNTELSEKHLLQMLERISSIVRNIRFAAPFASAFASIRSNKIEPIVTFSPFIYCRTSRVQPPLPLGEDRRET